MVSRATSSSSFSRIGAVIEYQGELLIKPLQASEFLSMIMAEGE